MRIKLRKSAIFKILLFLAISVIALYFVKEDICGVFYIYPFCYRIYGFPFSYLAYLKNGDIQLVIAQAKDLFLGGNFIKHGNFLINPVTLMLNLIFAYVLAWALVALYNKIKFKG